MYPKFPVPAHSTGAQRYSKRYCSLPRIHTLTIQRDIPWIDVAHYNTTDKLHLESTWLWILSYQSLPLNTKSISPSSTIIADTFNLCPIAMAVDEQLASSNYRQLHVVSLQLPFVNRI